GRRDGIVAVYLVPRPEHVDSGPDTDLHPALHFQRDQRFPDRRAGYPELFRQITLRRQPGASHELARANELPDLVGDLPIQTARFDALEWHGRRMMASAAPLLQGP